MPKSVQVRLEVPGVKVEFRGSTDLWERILRPGITPLAEGRWRAGSRIEEPRGPAEPPMPGEPREAGVASGPTPVAIAPSATPLSSPSVPAVEPRAALSPAAAAAAFLGVTAPSSMSSRPAFAPAAPVTPIPPVAPTGPASFRPAASASPPAASRPAAPVPPRPAAPLPSPVRTTASGSPKWDPRPLYATLATQEGRRGEKDAVLLALVSLAVEGKRDVTAADVMNHLESQGYPVKGLKAKPILHKFMSRKNLVVPGLLPNTFRATPAAGGHVTKRLRAIRGVQ